MRRFAGEGVLTGARLPGGPREEPAAVAFADGRIRWVGAAAALPAEFRVLPRLDVDGRLVTAAPVDCHTHLVFAGHRADEFALRLSGASYAEIARAGGGILSTVRATRAASEAQLVAEALPRLDALLAEGVVAVEIKSGYGLDFETERRMLRAARRLAVLRPVRVRTSFLGAHAVPPEYAGRADAYLAEVCLPALRALAREGLVDAVDAFCETVAFTPAQVERLFEEARRLGLPVRLHAEQLSRTGGALLAARHRALSADHLEYAGEEDAAALAAAGTVAVLLPGAFYYLREKRTPPVAAFRAHGVAMAVATDCNPGSSPLTSLLLAANMACVLFGLTPEEAFAGITVHAARAAGFDDTGRIAPEMRADLCVWEAESITELVHRIGSATPLLRLFGGCTC